MRRNPQTDRSTAVGNGGNINIDTNILNIFDVAQIDNSVFGEGNAGNININAKEISLNGVRSAIASEVRGSNLEGLKDRASGNSGNIYINTNSLSLDNISYLLTDIQFGTEGKAGDIIINSTDRISVDRNSLILSQVANGARGDAGKIEITTGNLSLDRSLLIANTSGFGNAGDIFIKAQNNISLDRNSLILATMVRKLM